MADQTNDKFTVDFASRYKHLEFLSKACDSVPKAYFDEQTQIWYFPGGIACTKDLIQKAWEFFMEYEETSNRG